MKVIICGDLVPTKSNESLFEHAEVEQLIGQDLVKILKDSDVCLCNLETPAVNVSNPIKKCGPNLMTSSESLNALPRMGINLVNLANNHILDQGQQGVISTIVELDNRGLSHIGAGVDISYADDCFFYSKENIKIGIYGVAEHEFSIATDNSAGANPYDPLYTFDRVKNIKKECDYLIVLYHGGIEEYRYPSPNLQKVCHKFVESGADFVVCQHSHCIGCEEAYLSKTIIYGQGNFIFDRKNNEFWDNSILVELEIRDGRTFKKYHPIVKTGFTVNLADIENEQSILSKFNKRSNDILTPGFIQNEYCHFSERKMQQYLSSFRGKKSFYYKLMNRLFGTRWLFSHYENRDYIRMRNYLECEAHLETFITALRSTENKRSKGK